MPDNDSDVLVEKPFVFENKEKLSNVIWGQLEITKIEILWRDACKCFVWNKSSFIVWTKEITKTKTKLSR